MCAIFGSFRLENRPKMFRKRGARSTDHNESAERTSIVNRSQPSSTHDWPFALEWSGPKRKREAPGESGRRIGFGIGIGIELRDRRRERGTSPPPECLACRFQYLIFATLRLVEAGRTAQWSLSQLNHRSTVPNEDIVTVIPNVCLND